MPYTRKISVITESSASDFRKKISKRFQECVASGGSPAKFFEEFFVSKDPNFRFYSWQKRFFDAAFDLNRTQKRIAVAAGNAMGKTYCSCLFMIASMLVSDYLGPMKARITTPTGQSSASTVMESIRRALIHFDLEQYFPYVKAGMITWADDKHGMIAQIYVMAIPTDQEKFDSIRGLHLPGGHLIMLYDECSRFPMEMWTENEGNMANPEGGYVTWLAISNPRESHGGFVNCFYEWRQSWIRFQVDMEEINADLEGAFNDHIANAKIMYGGENSPEYLCYIKSQFTLASDSGLFDNAFLLSLAENELDYESDALERPVMGVDVSTGVGKAFSAVCVRKSKSVPYWERGKYSIAELIEWIISVYRSYGARQICVDAGGYGRAVYEALINSMERAGMKEAKSVVVPIYAGGTADNPGVYKNRRAECIARMAEWFYSGPKAVIPSCVVRALCHLREINHSELKDFTSKKCMKVEQEALDMLDALLYSFPPEPVRPVVSGRPFRTKRAYNIVRRRIV